MGTVYMMIDKLKQSVKSSGYDAALIVSPENRFYFTGFESSDGYLIASENEAVFITDGRYIEAAQKKTKGCKVVLQEKKASQIRDILLSLGAKSVAVEADRMTLSEFTLFASVLEGIEMIADGSLDAEINDIRSLKTSAEVEKIKTAQKIAEEALEHIIGFIKPGKTEKEVALELDYYMLSHGAHGISFETIAVSGAKSSMPHGVPDEKVIENGDFVTMDFGAVFEGYHSDMTRTVAVGSASEEMKEVYYTVLKAQENAVSAIQAGLSCKAADQAARDVIEKAGYGKYFTHSTGHGVGVEIHEFPSLSSACDKMLKTGNIVTVEPGIYIPGKFGVRIEDMVLVTENGCENLTKAPKELIIL